MDNLYLITVLRSHPQTNRLDLYWKNRGWGTPSQTVEMVVSWLVPAHFELRPTQGRADQAGQALRQRAVYECSSCPRSQRRFIEAQRHGLQVGHSSCHWKPVGRARRISADIRLIIITARSEKQREGTEEWLAIHLPDSELIKTIRSRQAFSH